MDLRINPLTGLLYTAFGQSVTMPDKQVIIFTFNAGQTAAALLPSNPVVSRRMHNLRRGYCQEEPRYLIGVPYEEDRDDLAASVVAIQGNKLLINIAGKAGTSWHNLISALPNWIHALVAGCEGYAVTVTVEVQLKNDSRPGWQALAKDCVYPMTAEKFLMSPELHGGSEITMDRTGAEIALIKIIQGRCSKSQDRWSMMRGFYYQRMVALPAGNGQEFTLYNRHLENHEGDTYMRYHAPGAHEIHVHQKDPASGVTFKKKFKLAQWEAHGVIMGYEVYSLNQGLIFELLAVAK